MTPLQPQTKKRQIFSNRHFKVSIEQIKGPLSLSAHAQRYVWKTPTSRNQTPKEPSKPSTPISPKNPVSLHNPHPLPHFNLSLQTSQIPDDWHHAIVTQVAKAPRTTDPSLFRPIKLTFVVCNVLEADLKEKMHAHLSHFLIFDVATAWFPPPTLNPGHPPRGRKINYKMARRRECGRPDLSRLI